MGVVGGREWGRGIESGDVLGLSSAFFAGPVEEGTFLAGVVGEVGRVGVCAFGGEEGHVGDFWYFFEW